MFFIFLVSFSSQAQDCGFELSRKEYQKLLNNNPSLLRRIETRKKNSSNERSTNSVAIVFIEAVDTDSPATFNTQQNANAAIASLNSKFSGSDLLFFQLGPIIKIENKNLYEKNSLLKSANPPLNISAGLGSYRLKEYFYSTSAIYVYINVLNNPNAAAKGAFPRTNDMEQYLGKEDNMLVGPVLLKANNHATTFPHEVGHVFNLLHTFQESEAYIRREATENGDQCNKENGWYFGNSSTPLKNYTCKGETYHYYPERAGGHGDEGDLVLDTPGDPWIPAAYGIWAYEPFGFTNCSYVGTYTDEFNMPFDPDYENLMSYACREHFSNGQNDRIDDAYYIRSSSPLTNSTLNSNSTFDISDRVEFEGTNHGVENATIYYDESLFNGKKSRTTSQANGSFLGMRYGNTNVNSKVMKPPLSVAITMFLPAPPPFFYGYDQPSATHFASTPYSHNEWTDGVDVLDIYTLVYAALVPSYYQTPWTSAYKKVAADMDRNGVVNNSDYNELNEIVLNTNDDIYDSGNRLVHPYAFIPEHITKTLANFNSGSTNPFSISGASYPAYITNDMSYQYPLVNGKMGFDMVKMGDLNASNSYANFTGNSSSRNELSFVVEKNDLSIRNGDLVKVNFVLNAKEQIVAYQMGMNVDSKLFDLMDVEEGDLRDFDKQNFNTGTFKNGEIRTLWVDFNQDKSDVQKESKMFSFVLKAKNDIKDLDDVFILEKKVLESKFYNKRGKLIDVDLVLDFERIKASNEMNYQSSSQGELVKHELSCYPNPTSDHLTIDFSTESNSKVDFVFRDIKGQEVKRISQYFTKGSNSKTINLLTFPTKGLIFLSVETDDGKIQTTSFIKK